MIDDEAKECEHDWKEGREPVIRRSFFRDFRWQDYEYCPKCSAFREKPR